METKFNSPPLPPPPPSHAHTHTAVFRVVSAVLHFGNLKFKQESRSDQALLPDNTVAQKICKLLGLAVTDFTKALLRPKIKTGREFTHKSQNKAQVLDRCSSSVLNHSACMLYQCPKFPFLRLSFPPKLWQRHCMSVSSSGLCYGSTSL